MKKLISALLVLVTVLLCFAGCGSSTNSTNNSPTTVNVSSVSLSKTELHMTVGDKASISATVSPSNATNKNITWSSTNTAVADYVNGNIVALGEGNCLIKATSHNGFVASCSVSVSPKQTLAESISFEGDSYITFEGASEDLFLTFSPDKLDNLSGSVTSSNNSIVSAKYDSGVNNFTGKQYIKITIEGKSVGTATITVTTKGGASCSTNITVKENMCDKVAVNVPSLPCTIDYGFSYDYNYQTYYELRTRTVVTDVEITKTQTSVDNVMVKVRIEAKKTRDEMGTDTGSWVTLCLYKENNVLCESEDWVKRCVVGETYYIDYYFNVDVSSGTNRTFTIKFVDKW